MVLHDTAADAIEPDDNGGMVVETLDISDGAVAAQVLAVQHAAYRVEADLIGSTDIPPLDESLSDLVDAPLHWRGVRKGSEIVAAMAFTQDDDGVDIDRLIVAPDSMRRGHGSALIASLGGELPITVSTGTKNGPACDFYHRHGFTETGQSEPVAGLLVTHFRRDPA